jgi:hypothetical protein
MITTATPPPDQLDPATSAAPSAASDTAAFALEDVSTPTIEPPPAGWPLLDPDALYGLPGAFVRALAPHTEADPAAVLVQFLCAFGNAVGRGPHFQVGKTRHGMNLFVAVAGSTSKSRKGDSWQPVNQLLTEAEVSPTTSNGTALPNLSPWPSRIANGLSTGEGLIYAVRDAGGTLPHGEIDEGVSDKRLLVVEGELARVFIARKREGNTLSPVLCGAWDGWSTLQTTTKNNPTKATDAHIGVIGHITLDELRRRFPEDEQTSGFANRFLWCLARRSAVLPDPGNVPKATWDDLVRRTKAALAFASQASTMWRDAEASDLWRAVYSDLSKAEVGVVGDVTARAEAQVLRLSCVYALLDGSAVVCASHLRAALAVWRYCAESAAFIFRQTIGVHIRKDEPLLHIMDVIYDALVAAPDGLTRTAIMKKLSGNVPSSQINQALDQLLKYGAVQKELGASSPRGGPRPERWFAVVRQSAKVEPSAAA